MTAVWAVLFLLSAFAAVCAVVFALRVARGEEKARLMMMSQASVSAPVGNIGVSLVCVEPSCADAVSSMLAATYPTSEVIAVVDSVRDGDIVAAMVARYGLVAVDYVPCGSLHVAGVRRLYRSRCRACRRLVMLDMAHGDAAAMYDAAAGVASYDYLLPVPCGASVRPYAAGRMASEAGFHPSYSVAAVVTSLGAPLAMVALEPLVECGGFHNLRKLISGRCGTVCRIDEPLADYTDGRPPAVFAFAAAAFVIATVAAVAVAAVNGSAAIGAVAANMVATVAVLMYVSGRVMVGKGVWSAFVAATCNFCRNLTFDIMKCGKIALPLLNH